jgi:hypothetical protein
VKHLGFFGLFPDATKPTSLCAINMGWRAASLASARQLKKATTSLIKL